MKYKVNMSMEKLIVRLLFPVSYVIYGLIVAFIFTIIGFSSKLSLILLGIAYVVNIPLSVSKNHRSFIDRLHSFLAAPIIHSMLILENIPLGIYSLLNIIIIGFVLGLVFGISSPLEAFFLALGVYGVSLCIAISPIGEWMLRTLIRCKKIKRKDQIEHIEPIFKEVLEKAQKVDPSISEDVELYIIDSKEANTFAIGRKTVCITEEMLKAPKEHIKAALAHEMGHIAHEDTNSILIFSVGNILLIPMLIAYVIYSKITSKLFDVLYACGGENRGIALSAKIYSAICDFLIIITALLWIQIGITLFRRSSRKNEFEADEFALKLGYGNALCEFLDSYERSSTKEFFAKFKKKKLVENFVKKAFVTNLTNDDVDKNVRVEALVDLGATYRKSYTEFPQKSYTEFPQKSSNK